MLLKSFTIVAALLFVWSVLGLGGALLKPHAAAITLVRNDVPRSPMPQRNIEHDRKHDSDKKAKVRHAILRDADVRRMQGEDEMPGKSREAMRRRLQAQSMT